MKNDQQMMTSGFLFVHNCIGIYICSIHKVLIIFKTHVVANNLQTFPLCISKLDKNACNLDFSRRIVSLQFHFQQNGTILDLELTDLPNKSGEEMRNTNSHRL